ncbi:LytS/YehU family sensor histidine kinase [Sporomusaceae bacterium BoRhaA]|nr:LytS/YehU family sensor histidine kinase [Pelorhabdus rhamnosifermentans]
MANQRIVGPIVGGLLGGPLVGVIAGIIGGLTRYFMGGFTVWPSVISNVIVGYISGMVYNHYGSQRINIKIAFITAVVCEGILKLMILTMSKPFQTAWQLEQVIGIATTISNSMAVAFFVYIVHDIIHEQHKAQALSVQQAISMIQKTSDFLQQGLNEESATKVAKRIYQETKAGAVAITDTEKVLAFVGSGEEQHLPGMPIFTAETKCAIKNKQAVIDAPLMVSNELVGTLKLYKKKNQIIEPHEAELIQGIANFLSLQLAQQKLDKQQLLLLQTEYSMLKAQISPHFFFNTLTTIQALIMSKPEKAAALIKDLAIFFRKTLKLGSEIVSLREELDSVNTYLRIEKARFQNQMHVSINIPEKLLNHPLPVFTLQPLVENAIRHGISIKKGGGTVQIVAYYKEEQLFVKIIDDGVGISNYQLQDNNPKFPPSSTGSGIGLCNVHRRIQKIYGSEFGLQFISIVGQGTEVTLNLPWTEEESGAIEKVKSTHCG